MQGRGHDSAWTREPDVVDGELNITPFLDVVVNLVLFLLATFFLGAWTTRHGRNDRFIVLAGMCVVTAVLLYSNRLV